MNPTSAPTWALARMGTLGSTLSDAWRAASTSTAKSSPSPARPRLTLHNCAASHTDAVDELTAEGTITQESDGRARISGPFARQMDSMRAFVEFSEAHQGVLDTPSCEGAARRCCEEVMEGCQPGQVIEVEVGFEGGMIAVRSRSSEGLEEINESEGDRQVTLTVQVRAA